MNNKRNDRFLWGVILVLVALFLVFHNAIHFNFFHIGLFTLICTILLAFILIKSVIRKNIGGVIVPAALLCILYRDSLGITHISTFTILAAAILLSIGLNMMFKKKHHADNEEDRYQNDYYQHDSSADAQNADGTYTQTSESDAAADRPAGESVHTDHISCDVSFSSSVKYVNCDCFRHGTLKCSFGELKVYFDHAFFADHAATVDVDVSFGCIQLYIPGDWKVVLNVSTTLGGIDEHGNKRWDDTSNILYVNGDISFGSLQIRYL